MQVTAVQTLYGAVFVTLGQNLDNCDAKIINVKTVSNVKMTKNAKTIYVGGLGASLYAKASATLKDVDITGNYVEPNSPTGFKNYIDSSALFAAVDKSAIWTASSVHIKLCGTNQYLPGASNVEEAASLGVAFEKCE